MRRDAALEEYIHRFSNKNSFLPMVSELMERNGQAVAWPSATGIFFERWIRQNGYG